MPIRICSRRNDMRGVFSKDGTRLRAIAAVFVATTAAMALSLSSPAQAAVTAYRPTDTATVILRLSDNAVETELTKLRAAVSRSPNDGDALIAYVGKLMIVGAATGNERYYGFAEQALTLASAATANRTTLLRAQLL